MKANDLRNAPRKPEEYTAEDEIIYSTDFSDPESYKKFLKIIEGEKLVGYDDKRGNMTIGVGRNLGPMKNFDENNPPKITQEQSDKFLEEDLRTARRNMAAEVSNFEGMDPALQNIATDLSYNLGATKFSRDFPSAKRALERGNLRGFRDNILYKDPVNKPGVKSAWNQQTGRRAAAIGAALAEMIKKRDNTIKSSQDARLEQDQYGL